MVYLHVVVSRTSYRNRQYQVSLVVLVKTDVSNRLNVVTHTGSGAVYFNGVREVCFTAVSTCAYAVVRVIAIVKAVSVVNVFVAHLHNVNTKV